MSGRADLACACCGKIIYYGVYCSNCITSMDDDSNLFMEMVGDNRYEFCSPGDKYKELDFNC